MQAKNRRSGSGRSAPGSFKFHNFVFNEGKQSFCLEEQDGNKKITVLHWKKSSASASSSPSPPCESPSKARAPQDELGSSSRRGGCTSRNKKPTQSALSTDSFASTGASSAPSVVVPIIREGDHSPAQATNNLRTNFDSFPLNPLALRPVRTEPEQTQPLDLSTKSSRREMWSVDSILRLDPPSGGPSDTTGSQLNAPFSRHLDVPSPATLLAQLSCNSPDARSAFPSFFPPNAIFNTPPPTSPMIEAMLEEEFQRFLRQSSTFFNTAPDANNNCETEASIEERLKSLRQEVLEMRQKSAFNEGFSQTFRTATVDRSVSPASSTSSTSRRTVSELDLKSPRSTKQIKRSIDDGSSSSLFKTKNDAMNRLRQLRKYTRNYLETHRALLTPTVASNVISSPLWPNAECTEGEDMQINVEDDDEEEEEEDEFDPIIKKLWPGGIATPTASASSSTVQSSASASSVDGSFS